MVDMLYQDPSKKFVYAEMAFFKKWWDEQTPTRKNLVRQLIDNKQLEIINAGWSMNDEAAPYYEDVIDNMAGGLEWAHNHLGVVPNIGWQQDPFGHSSTNARIQAKLGYDIIVFSRIDEADRQKRFKNHTLRGIWNPHGREKILHEINVGNYCEPFFIYTNDDTTIKYKADQFYKYILTNSAYYEKKVIMQLLGCDFGYVDAPQVYNIHLTAIKYIWAHPEDYPLIDFKYSLVSEYIADLKASGETFVAKQDDFFVYGDNPSAYWSGYFTSRPLMKYLTRYAGKIYQAIRQMVAFDMMAMAPKERKQTGDLIVNATLQAMSVEMGACQHHDAVSGTAKQYVTDDYYARLHTVLNNATDITYALNIQKIKELFMMSQQMLLQIQSM